ncbi:hypothetical protein BKA62DRAFT_783961 [Auriculariales sp. MPI-PUGE-AT-0066]|nr:hypothetical protein BKA62DRAFT_783961 [Auriculariales sp. MPI-PUGE-AT-0066]
MATTTDSRITVLETLREILLPMYSPGEYADVPESCADGTRVDVLSAIYEWAKGTSTARVFRLVVQRDLLRENPRLHALPPTTPVGRVDCIALLLLPPDKVLQYYTCAPCRSRIRIGGCGFERRQMILKLVTDEPEILLSSLADQLRGHLHFIFLLDNVDGTVDEEIVDLLAELLPARFGSQNRVKLFITGRDDTDFDCYLLTGLSRIDFDKTLGQLRLLRNYTHWRSGAVKGFSTMTRGHFKILSNTCNNMLKVDTGDACRSGLETLRKAIQTRHGRGLRITGVAYATTIIAFEFPRPDISGKTFTDFISVFEFVEKDASSSPDAPPIPTEPEEKHFKKAEELTDHQARSELKGALLYHETLEICVDQWRLDKSSGRSAHFHMEKVSFPFTPLLEAHQS